MSWKELNGLKAGRWLLACIGLLVLGTAMPNCGLVQAANHEGPGPGLLQYWYEGRVNDRDAAEDLFDADDPLVDPFRADHGTSWWFGHQIRHHLSENPGRDR